MEKRITLCGPYKTREEAYKMYKYINIKYYPQVEYVGGTKCWIITVFLKKPVSAWE